MVNYGLGRRHKSKESGKESLSSLRATNASMASTASRSSLNDAAALIAADDAAASNEPYFHFTPDQQDALLEESRATATALIVDTLSGFDKWRFVSMNAKVQLFELKEDAHDRVSAMRSDDPHQALAQSHTLLAITRVRAKLDDFMRIVATDKRDKFRNLLTCLHEDEVQHADVFTAFGSLNNNSNNSGYSSNNNSNNNSSNDLLSSSFTSNSSFSSSRGPHKANSTGCGVDVEQYAIKYYSLKEPKVVKPKKSARNGMTPKFIRKGKTSSSTSSSSSSYSSSSDSGSLTLCVGEYATIRQGKMRSSSSQQHKSGSNRTLDDHRIGIVACHSVGDPQVTRYCKPIASTTGSGFAVTSRSFAQFSGIVVYPIESSTPGESLLEVVIKISCFDPQGISALKKQAMMQYLAAYRHLENALLVLRLHDSPFRKSSAWVKSETRKCCNVCQQSFQSFRRKHHCRLCGEVVCSKCSSIQVIKLAKAGKDSFRICDGCLHGAGDTDSGSMQRLPNTRTGSGPERSDDDDDEEEEEVVEVDSELQPIIRRESLLQNDDHAQQKQQHMQMQPEPQYDELAEQLQQQQQVQQQTVRRVPSVRRPQEPEPVVKQREQSVRGEKQQPELVRKPSVREMQQPEPLREPSMQELQQYQPKPLREPSIQELQKFEPKQQQKQVFEQVKLQVQQHEPQPQHQTLLHKQQLEQHDSRHKRHDQEHEKAAMQLAQDKQRAESTASSGDSELYDSRGFLSSNVTATTAASTPPSNSPSPLSSSPASPSAAVVHNDQQLYGTVEDDDHMNNNSSMNTNDNGDRFSQSLRYFHDSEFALDLSDLHLESSSSNAALKKPSAVFNIDEEVDSEEENEGEDEVEELSSSKPTTNYSSNVQSYGASYDRLDEEDDDDDDDDMVGDYDMSRETGFEFHDSEVGINFNFEDIEEFNDEKYEAMEALEEIQEITTTSAAMLQRMRLLDELRRTRLMVYDILDSAREQSFDLIATQAAQFMSCSLASISFVDDRREFIKAASGDLMLRMGAGAGGSSSIQELPKQHSLAAHIVQRCAVEDLDMVLVLDARHDEALSTNLFVYNAPHLRFVVGIPVRTRDGVVLGALVVADDRPRGDMTPTESKVLRDFAEQVNDLLEERWQRRMYQRRAAPTPAPEQIQQTLQSLLSQSYHTGQQLRQQQTESQNFHRSMPLPRQHQPRYQQQSVQSVHQPHYQQPPQHQPRYQQQQRPQHQPQYQSSVRQHNQQQEPLHGRLTMQGIEL